MWNRYPHRKKERMVEMKKEKQMKRHGLLQWKQLCIMAVMTLLCVSGFYMESKAATIVHEGVSGNLNWNIDSEGVLTISGTGNYTRNGSKLFRRQSITY